MEKVQRRATKMFCIRNKPYEQRIKTLRLTTLEDRRIRGDLIQMFKIVKEKDKISWVKKPRIIHSITRGHNLRYEQELIKNSSNRYNYFVNRIANEWNKLPQETVDSTSVTAFKRNLDKFKEKFK